MRIVLLGNKAAGAGNGLAAYRYLMRNFNALEHAATPVTLVLPTGVAAPIDY